MLNGQFLSDIIYIHIILFIDLHTEITYNTSAHHITAILMSP